MTLINEDSAITADIFEPEMNRRTCDLLDKIWTKIGSDKQSNSLVSGIMRMTRRALNVSAASLFLVDEEKQELLLKFAAGEISGRARRFPIDAQSGITGWVAQSGKALVTNTVTGNPRYNRMANAVYGFIPRSIVCVPLIVRHKAIGVIEVANKTGRNDFTAQNLQTLTGIAATVALVLENIRLNDCLRDYYKSTVNALVSLADAKETAGCGHSKRVAEYALMGAKKLALPAEMQHSIEYAAILHDIGKLAIPDAILNKPDALNDDEMAIIHQHPEIGFNLIRKIPFLEDASWLVLYHHEKFDGTGYPRQIKGRAIPIGARLIAVADAFDNMTTEHSYRAALSKKRAFIELNKYVRTQFCPIAVKAFFSGFLDSRKLYKL
jgi:putative nucleotidyltransferase with HDIG domain